MFKAHGPYGPKTPKKWEKINELFRLTASSRGNIIHKIGQTGVIYMQKDSLHTFHFYEPCKYVFVTHVSRN